MKARLFRFMGKPFPSRFRALLTSRCSSSGPRYCPSALRSAKALRNGLFSALPLSHTPPLSVPSQQVALLSRMVHWRCWSTRALSLTTATAALSPLSPSLVSLYLYLLQRCYMVLLLCCPCSRRWLSLHQDPCTRAHRALQHIGPCRTSGPAATC